MLWSEIVKWQWAITWDNAAPNRNSAPLRAALGSLGRIDDLATKTTVILSPKVGVTEAQIKAAITQNLDPTTGSASLTDLQTRDVWEWGPNTQQTWNKAN